MNKFENEPLNESQKLALLECIQELEEWVQKFGISSDPIEVEEASEIADESPNLVFSLGVDDHATPSASPVQALESGLAPGFDDECELFYVSKKPWGDDDSPYPYTEIFFTCSACEDSEDPGRDCEFCEDGNFIYELIWDEEGRVTAERTV